MNIVRTPRLFAQSLLLVPLLAASLILSACGGSDNKNTSVSSSSSSANSHSLVPTPVTPSGSGDWPAIKVSANGTKQLKFEWNSAPASTHYKLLKKADANSSYQQVGADIPDPTASGAGSIADAVSVHLTDWVNSRYLVQACNGSNCVDSTEIVTNSAMLSAITYIKASNAEADDWFGWSIALSGDGQTLAVGAPTEDSKAVGVNQDQNNNESPNSGAVYVFIKNANGDWEQQAYLKASNTEQPNKENSKLSLPNDRFGYQVALSPDGNSLAVSAIQEDSPARGINCTQYDLTYSYSSSSSTTSRSLTFNIGAVYIFKRSDSVWAQTTYVKPYNPMEGGLFGTSLSLSGDGKLLAVGTYMEGTYAAGIYDLRSVSSSSCIDFSASSISSSSSSSSAESSSSSSIMGGQESGAVYLFRETDSGWVEETYIKASDAGALDHFGNSLSLSHDGNTLAVGAPGEDSIDTGPTNDYVVVNGVSIIRNNGGVYIFTYANDAWTQQAKVKPYDNGFSQQFGFSLALSGDGNTLAVGAPGDWSKSSGVEAITAGVIGPLGANYDLTAATLSYATGAAYIFVKDAETWRATTYLKASNAQAGYQFGHNLSLSKDGSTLAVGSVEEASGATGINGDPVDSSAKASGAAYIFKLSGTTWEQKSYVKAPNTATNDRFANSLKLDDSGDILAVGAHRESGSSTGINGDKANSSLTTATGAVYLF